MATGGGLIPALIGTAIDAAADQPLEEGLSIERLCYERTLASKDRLEALAAFAEKRKPVFKGE